MHQMMNQQAERRARSVALFLLKAKKIDRISQNSLDYKHNDTLDEVMERSSFLTPEPTGPDNQ